MRVAALAAHQALALVVELLISMNRTVVSAANPVRKLAVLSADSAFQRTDILLIQPFHQNAMFRTVMLCTVSVPIVIRMFPAAFAADIANLPAFHFFPILVNAAIEPVLAFGTKIPGIEVEFPCVAPFAFREYVIPNQKQQKRQKKNEKDQLIHPREKSRSDTIAAFLPKIASLLLIRPFSGN